MDGYRGIIKGYAKDFFMKKHILTFLLISAFCLPKAEAGLGYAAAGFGALAGVGLVAGAAKVALTKKDREILKNSYALLKDKKVKQAVKKAISMVDKDPVLAVIVGVDAILAILALGCGLIGGYAEMMRRDKQKNTRKEDILLGNDAIWEDLDGPPTDEEKIKKFEGYNLYPDDKGVSKKAGAPYLTIDLNDTTPIE